ncbi:MAG TPA: hypothetical protein VIG24_13310 [Acidimicrobiia bacterium]
MRGWKRLLLHRDDRRYVKVLLDGLGRPDRLALLRGYAEAWEAGEAAEPSLVKRQNAGRKAANIWIREEAKIVRYGEPEDVKHWRAEKHRQPPACCHTCEHYDQHGTCTKFDQDPPEDFAAMIGACPEWEEEIPF